MLSKNARSMLTEQEAMSQLVVQALWQSFPEHNSEAAIAEAAREYFRDKNGDPISARTVRYWLRGQTLPSALHLATLVQMQPNLFICKWLGAA